MGEQTVDGNGEIVLGRENAIGDNLVNNSLRFSGQTNGLDTLTLDTGLTIRGQGRFDASSLTDEIDLKGTLRAEDGQLDIRGFDQLDGTLGAADDGILEVEEDLEMLEQGKLEIGVSEAGVGRLEVLGSLDRDGTLALDVADDFVANLGDTFEFVTTRNGLTGNFQTFEGFDLAGSLAFVLDETDGDLSLRVATDAEAQEQGFLSNASNLSNDNLF